MNRLVNDLDVIAQAGIATSRYQSWRAEHGVPVRITVGEPKFWRHGELEEVQELAPWERSFWRDGVSAAEMARIYRDRLDRHGDEAIAKLAAIARAHPGQRLVLLCFEDVDAGQECHRRWFAEWFERRYGLVVPELAVPGQQQRLPV